MPNPIPTPVASDATGLPDSQWVGDVRDALEDYPDPKNESWTADGVGGVFGAGAGPLRLQNKPYDGTPVGTYVSVTDNGVAQTVVTTAPTSGQVQIDYNKRALIFPTAPTSTHTIAVGYYSCTWTDASILTALYAGLRQMFPSVGKTYFDSSIQIQVNKWDYTLPLWAQAPDAQISLVEFQDPSIATEPWRPLNNWARRGLTQLHVPGAQRLSPVAKLRVTGWGGYQQLSDLEPDLYHLPIWYALSVLLPKKEAFRIRQDTMVPLTQEGGQQPGLQVQTGDYYAKRFDAELKQKKRAYGPPGSSRPIATTYAVTNHF